MRRNRADTIAYEAAKSRARAMILGGSSQDEAMVETGLGANAVARLFRELGVKRVCATPGCDRPIQALGLCKKCHQREWSRKQGSPAALNRRVSDLEAEIASERARSRAAANALLIAENDALKRRVAELEAELADELDGVGKRESQRVRDLVDQLRDAQGSRDLYKSGCVGLEMRLKAALKLLGKPYSESTLEALGGPTSRSEDDPST